jgi:hypothetical protein
MMDSCPCGPLVLTSLYNKRRYDIRPITFDDDGPSSKARVISAHLVGFSICK